MNSTTAPFERSVSENNPHDESKSETSETTTCRLTARQTTSAAELTWNEKKDSQISHVSQAWSWGKASASFWTLQHYRRRGVKSGA